MQRLFFAIILAISIHAAVLSIKINIVQTPERVAKPEPIRITMSYRHIKKEIKETAETAKPEFKRQQPETKTLKPVPKKNQATKNNFAQKPLLKKKIKPVQKEQEDKDTFIKNRAKEHEKIIAYKADTKLELEQEKLSESLLSPPNKLIDSKEQSKPTASKSAVIHTKAIPKYKSNPKLGYPRIAKKRGYHGQVLLLVVVSKTGAAKKVMVKKSSGHSILDKAARKAVNQWQFYPGTKDGKPVEMSVTLPIRFDLK